MCWNDFLFHTGSTLGDQSWIFSHLTDVFNVGCVHTSGTMPLWIIYMRLSLFFCSDILC